MSRGRDILAAFGERFVLVAEYAGGEGVTLCVDDGGALRVLKVLPAGEQPVEASLLLSLRHPAIPAVREVGALADGRPYVLRDHVEGQALASLPREPASLRVLLQQLLEVLAYVHQRGVLHLDLKPSNLLLGPDGRLHLLDFGLGARLRGAARGGTPFFAAPELLLGMVPDARADLFAVGAMVAQALWPGELPLRRFLDAFPRDDFWRAGGVGAEQFPAPFDRFLRQCVSRRPQRRFPDAAAALESLCGGSGRPSAALLDPDPVLLFAAELAVPPGGGDVVVRGGEAPVRRAIAMHLAATVPGATAIVEAADQLQLRRGDGEVVTIELPAVDAGRLRLHLQAAFGLEGQAADNAAAWLVARANGGVARIGELLRELLANGELMPAGTRWSWPAARSGRLAGPLPPPLVAAAITAATVRDEARAGRGDRAVAQWRVVAGSDDEARERAVRSALAEGLLDGGEPARALPFAAGMPLLRAQALLDSGQVAAAAAEFARAAVDEDPARHRRCAAQLAIASGHPERAVSLWPEPPTAAWEAVTLAAAHEQLGDLEACERVLQMAATELVPASAPFACASACTIQGHVARRRGDLSAARQRFASAAELLAGIGQLRHAATAQLNLGVIQKDLGDHRAALETLREARGLYEHVGDEARATVALANLGIAALARGDAATARPWLEQAATALLRLGHAPLARQAQVHLARACVELGDEATARAILDEIGGDPADTLGTGLSRGREPAPKPPPTATMTPTMTDGQQGPSRELFRTFLAVNRQLAAELDLERAMRHLLDAAVTLTGGRMGYLLVARDDGMRREFQSGDSSPAGQAFSRSLAHRAMQTQRTLTGADALLDRDLQDAPSIKNLQVRSAICAPFRSAGGTVGAVYVEHPGRAGAFAETDKQALEVLADQAAIAVDRMLREQAMAEELQASQQELAVVRRTRRDAGVLLGDSAPMAGLRAQIDKLAPIDLPVLIHGETGTGKELVARALHERSGRHRGPFVAENCSALPAELMERELFGHVQGAFTGADRDRPGLLELANGGTLFLDEVGDMPPALQAKLLRALQEKVIRRVGGDDVVPLDLRLVAATHKDLRAMVQRGEFREDLFFRLAAVEVRVPPLRERGDDVLLLAEHFVRRAGQQRGQVPTLSPAVRAALRDHDWPGNVRELEHVIARAVLLCDGERVEDLQLPPPRPPRAGGPDGMAPAVVITLKEAERRAIVAALQSCGGDKAKTARTLGISRTALYEKLKRHGLGRDGGDGQ
ncbi:MAG: sigma 54-interacting transcriptional regulator [Planctomycetes bacterium]|nr:sigma 54-interacting transcriptional regulator [Planctomycetota bacterium]